MEEVVGEEDVGALPVQGGDCYCADCAAICFEVDGYEEK